MQYLTFSRENNNFDDILKDKTVKKVYRTKIQYYGHLILGLDENLEDTTKILSYIILKYGHDIVTLKVIDRTPIPYKDYVPQRKRKNSKKVLTS